ncbi:MAG: hypothetical protein CME06_17425 [Gemmatimonadetes bacterium]|nr:hypothetical protein [Gemmatimonadota bacterium]
MDADRYVEERLDDQISWYDEASGRNQRAFKLLQISALIASASIPLLSAYTGEYEWARFGVGLLGVFVAVATGMLSLGKYQENWIGYRGTCESLKHEKYMYLSRGGVYSVDEPLPVLAMRVENLISAQNSVWRQYSAKEDSESEA